MPKTLSYKEVVRRMKEYDNRFTKGLLNRYCRDDGGVFGRLKNIRFVLVDDHFDLGYHHVLGYTLFGSGYSPPDSSPASWGFKPSHGGHSLKCFSSLEWLLRCIGDEVPKSCQGLESTKIPV